MSISEPPPTPVRWIVRSKVSGRVVLTGPHQLASQAHREAAPSLGNPMFGECEYLQIGEPTDAQLDAKLRSFAYGNLALAEPGTTREAIDRAVDEMIADHTPVK